MPRKYQRSLKAFGSAAAPLGTGSTRASTLCSVCQTSSYPHWTCHSEDARAFKNPRASTFWVLKNPPGGWSVECWDPVRICEHFLKGAALWEIEDNQKFLKGVRLFIADGQKKQKHWSNSCAHEVSVLWMSWQPYKSMGDWQSSSDEYLCFEFLFLPWDLHSSPIQICIFFFNEPVWKGDIFWKSKDIMHFSP